VIGYLGVLHQRTFSGAQHWTASKTNTSKYLIWHELVTCYTGSQIGQKKRPSHQREIKKYSCCRSTC